MKGIKDSQIIVTGAASGVGAELAQLIQAAGGKVISLDRHEPSASVHRHITVDLSEPTDIDRVLGQLDGPFHGLANVAAVAGTAPREVVFKVNFLGLRHLTDALVARIVPGGSIVNVASIAGANWPERLDAIKDLLKTRTFEEGEQWLKKHPHEEVPPYNFSKEIVTVYSMSRAVDLLPEGPRFNVVNPSAIETPLLKDFRASMGNELLDRFSSVTGRNATSNDIAEAILFLLSDNSRWVKGHALVVDGGGVASMTLGRYPSSQ